MYIYVQTDQWNIQRFHSCHLSLICVSQIYLWTTTLNTLSALSLSTEREYNSKNKGSSREDWETFLALRRRISLPCFGSVKEASNFYFWLLHRRWVVHLMELSTRSCRWDDEPVEKNEEINAVLRLHRQQRSWPSARSGTNFSASIFLTAVHANIGWDWENTTASSTWKRHGGACNHSWSHCTNDACQHQLREKTTEEEKSGYKNMSHRYGEW